MGPNRERVANFPIKTIDEIILSNKEKSEANRETVVTDFPCENVKCLTTNMYQKN